jgi:hypothetical protein
MKLYPSAHNICYRKASGSGSGQIGTFLVGSGPFWSDPDSWDRIWIPGYKIDKRVLAMPLVLKIV